MSKDYEVWSPANYGDDCDGCADLRAQLVELQGLCKKAIYWWQATHDDDECDGLGAELRRASRGERTRPALKKAEEK